VAHHQALHLFLSIHHRRRGLHSGVALPQPCGWRLILTSLSPATGESAGVSGAGIPQKDTLHLFKLSPGSIPNCFSHLHLITPETIVFSAITPRIKTLIYIYIFPDIGRTKYRLTL
jgi:hypothetical protein